LLLWLLKDGWIGLVLLLLRLLSSHS